MKLPAPDGAFRWSVESWGHALRCGPLEAVAQHLFTTKQLELRPPADSVGEAFDTAVASRSGRHERRVSRVGRPSPWTLATLALGADLGQLMRVKQVHGRTVRVLRKGAITAHDAATCPEADALASDADLVLAVEVADCVPILMADRRSGTAAAVHAGWRGTAAGVVAAAVETLASEFGTDAKDLMVAIGPSIGACCYEVGAEVYEVFRAAGATEPQRTRWFSRSTDGALRLDLWAANHDQLSAAGVRGDHIFLSRLCTKTHSDIFESFRAVGQRVGRMAALIRVPAAP